MPGSGIWDRLGIAPTTDAAAIRQAYAERLKHVRPDDDPEGFRLLRDAFEAARRGQDAPQPGTTPSKVVKRRPARTAPAPPDPTPAPDLALLARDAVQSKLHVGWPLDAAWAWRDNEARLTLDDAERLQGAIAVALAAGSSINLGTLDEAIGLMRWQEAGRRLDASPAVLDVLARRAAEVWWGELQAASQARFCWQIARQLRNRAARIVLLRAPGPIRRRFPYIFLWHDLNYWLIAWPQHRRFLGGRLSTERLDWCQAALYRWDARWVVRLWTAYLLAILAAIPIAVVLLIADL